MNIFQTLRSNSNISNEQRIWRERNLQSMLFFATTIGIITYAINLPSALINKQYINAIVYSVLLVAVVILTFLRNLKYGLRASFFLGVFAVLTTTSFLENGLTGNSRVFLLGFLIITGLLFGTRTTLITTGLSIIFWIGFGIATTQGWISPITINQMDSNEWFLGGIYFVLIASILISSIGSLINGLQNAVYKMAEVSSERERDLKILEGQFSERSVKLESRSAQVRTASTIVRSISGMLDSSTLLLESIELIREQFKLYYVGIFLLDKDGEYAVLRAGTGDAGQRMLARNHRLAVGGSSMIGWCTAQRQPRIALDTGKEAVRFNNPDLPLTRSEMALPIFTRERTWGALTIQSTQENAFDEDDIVILQGIADALAVSLENANLFEQTQKSLDEVRALNRAYLQQTWKETSRVYGNLKYEYENSTAMPSKEGAHVNIPLTLREQPIGTMRIHLGEQPLHPEEVEFIEAIATQTAVALENARLLEETMRRASQEQKLNQMTAQFSRAVNLEDVLKSAVQELGQLPNVSEVSIHLVPPEAMFSGKGGN